MHNWINKPVGTATGWYRCTKCGTRRHFVDGPPAADFKIYNGVEYCDCEQIVGQKAAAVLKKIENLLQHGDAATDEIRANVAIMLEPEPE